MGDNDGLASAYERTKEAYLDAKHKAQSNRPSSTSSSSACTAAATRSMSVTPRSVSAAPTAALNDIRLPAHVKARIVTAALERLHVQRPTDRVLTTELPAPAISNVVQDIEARLLVEVKIAGMRRGREKSLMDLLKKLKATRTASMSAQEDALSSWVEHADDIAVAAYRHLDACDRKLKASALALAGAKESKDRVIAEVKLAHEHLQQAQDVAKANLEAACNKMRAEADDAAEVLAAKHQEELQELRCMLQSSQEESSNEKMRLQDGLSTANTTIEQLKERMCQLGKDKECYVAKQEDAVASLINQLRASEQALGEKQIEIENLQKVINGLKGRLEDETEQLNTVEEKVKRILAAKDAKIARLLRRAEEAEEQIRSIERDFAEVG